MNDDELRRVLHEEADRFEVGEHSWSRVESRFASSHSSRSSVLVGIAVVSLAVIFGLRLIPGGGYSVPSSR